MPARLTTNGEQGSLDRFQQWGSGKTLRQLASERFDNELDLIGTPDEVADKMAAAMDEVGGDGFLISTPFQRTSRRYINEVCEGLVPALQRRGLVRQAYTRSTLRETLREFSAQQRDHGHGQAADGTGTDRAAFYGRTERSPTRSNQRNFRLRSLERKHEKEPDLRANQADGANATR